MEYFGVFYDRLVFLRPFGVLNGLLAYFVASLVNFFPFWFNAPRKIWQPWVWI
jgi:hypothetical protein